MRSNIFKSAAALLCAAVMLASFLAGCGTNTDLPSGSASESDSFYSEAPGTTPSVETESASDETDSSESRIGSEPSSDKESSAPTESKGNSAPSLPPAPSKNEPTQPTEPTSPKPTSPKPTEPTTNPPASNVSAQMEQVLALVNKERAAAGLSPLVFDSDLNAAAAIRSKEIQTVFDHTRPDGTPWHTVSNKAYGENIAAGYPNADAVMVGWMNSEGHRKNILSPRYKTIGVGYTLDKNGSPCWVQLFGI